MCDVSLAWLAADQAGGTGGQAQQAAFGELAYHVIAKLIALFISRCCLLGNGEQSAGLAGSGLPEWQGKFE